MEGGLCTLIMAQVMECQENDPHPKPHNSVFSLCISNPLNRPRSPQEFSKKDHHRAPGLLQPADTFAENELGQVGPHVSGGWG